MIIFIVVLTLLFSITSICFAKTGKIITKKEVEPDIKLPDVYDISFAAPEEEEVQTKKIVVG
ncbi:MAG: hypothetical protein ACOCV8_04625 [Spirochaetota bacterium]